ncbi:YesK family protein [Virgibacillus sp. YIM 98842]|uniref:YesK family protein n=1 Tax=Virgibacillus sp. YIM 98842 TaxID=2663533 RepID=UPI0013DB3095|nr:YesK family protein [Virgibacillus sp. YIM 98842]
MLPFIIVSIITAIVLLGFNWFFSRKRSPMRYILPMIVVLISIALIFISFVIGEWEGMGIGLYGFAIFIGAALSLIITAFISSAKDLKKSLRNKA